MTSMSRRTRAAGRRRRRLRRVENDLTAREWAALVRSLRPQVVTSMPEAAAGLS